MFELLIFLFLFLNIRLE